MFGLVQGQVLRRAQPRLAQQRWHFHVMSVSENISVDADIAEVKGLTEFAARTGIVGRRDATIGWPFQHVLR